MINIQNGKCVIMNSILLSLAMDEPLAPAGVKVAISPGFNNSLSVSAPVARSSGLAMSVIPIRAGSPMWTGVPCASGKRAVTRTDLIASNEFLYMRQEHIIGPLKGPTGWHWRLVR